MKGEIQNLTTRLDNIQTQQTKLSTSVAFSARRTTTFNTTVPTIITYDKIISNEAGAFDGSTGKFTAPIRGSYFFSLFVLGERDHLLRAEITLNGV